MRVGCALILLVIGAAVACAKKTPGYTSPEGNGGGPVDDCFSDAGCMFVSGVTVELSCNDVLYCLNACASGDTACQSACTSEASTAGSSLFSALNGCIDGACPAGEGSVCSGTDAGACQSCAYGAQEDGGACVSQLNACELDTSGTGTLGCDAILKCDEDCTSSGPTCGLDCYYDGTGEGLQLYESLSNCVASACPESDGGVCESQTMGCGTCENEAINDGGCASPASACFADMSGEAAVGCGKMWSCWNNCVTPDAACLQGCKNGIPQSALNSFQTAYDCVSTACPNSGGGVCADGGSACLSCQQMAEQAGGGCYSDVSKCVSD